MRICSTDRMRFGVHLPLMDFGDQSFAVDRLVNYVQTATALGFDAIAANDHILFATPWLDGPTALAAVVFCSGDARLFTTVANPVVRGPAALAKVLAGLDVMSGGRLIAGLGPGSSEWDYANVGFLSMSAGSVLTRPSWRSGLCCAGNPSPVGSLRSRARSSRCR
jgi:alkanesulfonate monooxygenase SsuD/methylene tetrahydromethanopterin reductase-like flavin-dependent oxidoreductase (luciferase family)